MYDAEGGRPDALSRPSLTTSGAGPLPAQTKGRGLVFPALRWSDRILLGSYSASPTSGVVFLLAVDGFAII